MTANNFSRSVDKHDARTQLDSRARKLNLLNVLIPRRLASVTILPRSLCCAEPLNIRGTHVDDPRRRSITRKSQRSLPTNGYYRPTKPKQMSEIRVTFLGLARGAPEYSPSGSVCRSEAVRGWKNMEAQGYANADT